MYPRINNVALPMRTKKFYKIFGMKTQNWNVIQNCDKYKDGLGEEEDIFKIWWDNISLNV